MTTASSVTVTYEECLLREESRLEEVINGELHIMPPASFSHAKLLRRIQKRLVSPLAIIEILAPANRKGHIWQLLQDYRNLGCPEITLTELCR